MIILEGPDGSGKSTLIKQLELETGLQSKHFGGPPVTIQELHERVALSKNERLLDRWSPISEQVYGPISGRMMSVDVLDTYVHQCMPIIVYCRPSLEVLMQNLERCLSIGKNHKSPTHCKMVKDNHAQIFSRYDAVMTKLRNQGVTVYQYDYTKPGALNELLEQLEN